MHRIIARRLCEKDLRVHLICDSFSFIFESTGTCVCLPCLSCISFTFLSDLQTRRNNQIKETSHLGRQRLLTLVPIRPGGSTWKDFYAKVVNSLLNSPWAEVEFSNDAKGFVISIWAATWKTQQNGCATSEDSDPPSLIRVFAIRMKKSWVLSYPMSAQRRLWSDWADAQADLNLRWANTHFVAFGMSRSYIDCQIYKLTIRMPFDQFNAVKKETLKRKPSILYHPPHFQPCLTLHTFRRKLMISQ